MGKGTTNSLGPQGEETSNPRTELIRRLSHLASLAAAALIVAAVWAWFEARARLFLGETEIRPGESWQYYYDSWQWTFLYGLLGATVLMAFIASFCWSRQKEKEAKVFLKIGAAGVAVWFAVFLIGI